MSIDFSKMKIKKEEEAKISYTLGNSVEVVNDCKGWFSGNINLHCTNLSGIIAIKEFLNQIIKDENERIQD